MDGDVPRLGKRAVEEMLRRASAPAAGPEAEIGLARDALHRPLAQVAGVAPGTGWTGVVERASALAGWTWRRRDLLRDAAQPERAEDVAATLSALWDLLTELNERRRL